MKRELFLKAIDLTNELSAATRGNLIANFIPFMTFEDRLLLADFIAKIGAKL